MRPIIACSCGGFLRGRLNRPHRGTSSVRSLVDGDRPSEVVWRRARNARARSDLLRQRAVSQREQAQTLAESAAGFGFASLWCSPLARARETGEIVAARIGLVPVYDARLMETDAGDWTDLMFDDVAASDPERFAQFEAGDPGFAFPGGESFLQQQDRVCAAIEEIRATACISALTADAVLESHLLEQALE